MANEKKAVGHLADRHRSILNRSHPLDLWSVKAFVAVAEELHFGRAARRLKLTQSTLSQRIRRLESDVGVPLFVRSTRNVELTAAGATFLPLARDVLTKLDEATLLSRIAAGGMSPGEEHLNIGTLGPAAYRMLPLILRRFRAGRPETGLNIMIADSSELIRLLEQGDCDVGLMRPPSNINSLRYKPLISERFLAVIPRDSILAGAPGLQLANFIGHRVFTLKRFEISGFEQVHNLILNAGIDECEKISASSTSSALSLVSAGAGITFLPAWVRNIADENVVLRPVDDLLVELTMGVGWRADRPTPGIAPFVEYAELVCRPLEALV
ncbi:LysR family transcriptional regulator [Sinorhizobium meliloti]|uniref:LysR family transcriptional regulator n=1 Tax=Rhizobium meliloti TaxID=382 RepID=UPI0009B7BD45|nr:LysR substrate-binding domain-containing protein [Sinorhizobium meliloti]ARS71026.1 LysR family transcriptional regulator [Sinorhizobium meliloti RU11/001]